MPAALHTPPAPVGRFAAGALLVVLMTVRAGTASAGNPPEVDFMLECQGCHRPGGEGWPGMVPKLDGHVSKFLHSEAGRAYLIRVPGVAQSTLSDARLAAVLTWVVEAFDPAHLPDDFVPYSATEVGHWRRQIVRNVTTERERVLRQSGFEAPDAYAVPDTLYARPHALP